MAGRRARFVIVVTLLMVSVVATPSQAGKGDTGGTAYQLERAVVQHGPVLLPDRGSPGDEVVYLGSEIRAGHILNRLEGSSEQDQLLLDIGSTKSGRYLGLADDGNVLLSQCAIARVYVWSATTPHWYENVGVAGHTAADGALYCYKDSRFREGWVIGFPSGDNECLRLEHVATNEWRVTAAQDCLSARWTITRGVMTLDRGWTAPAPFAVVWHRQPTKFETP